MNNNNGDKSDTGNSNTNIYSWKNLVTATSVKIATVLSAQLDRGDNNNNYYNNNSIDMPSIRTRGGEKERQRSYHCQTRRFSVV